MCCSESAERGHCFLPLNGLAKTACELLAVDDERIDIAVEKLAERNEVVLQDQPDRRGTRVYLVELFEAEKRVADALARLLSTASFLQSERLRPWEKDKSGARGAIDLLSWFAIFRYAAGTR